MEQVAVDQCNLGKPPKHALPPLQSFSPNGKVDHQLIIVVSATHIFVVFTDQLCLIEQESGEE